MVLYRKDIQSLRGLSSLLVFFYHFNKNILPTGFIGVDIFFFISGYVNILSFLSKNDKSKGLFYFNRLKRLFPVAHLTFMFAIIMVKRMNILYQNKLYVDILCSLFSLSNYRFIFLSVDYLSQSESSSVVLHFWSLSVEDQFYLFYPFFISILYKNTTLIISILLLSIVYSCYLNYKNHFLSYFSIFSRLWQLLFGVISTKKIIYLRTMQNNDLLLIFIFIFCFLIKKEIYFPAPLSIIPLTIIYFIISSKKYSFILENELFVLLGNISYSFYLFHYLIIYQYRDKKKNISSLLIILFFTFTISYSTNVLYENPVRKSSNNKSIIIFFLLSLSSLFIICILLLNINTKYMKNKYRLNSLITSTITSNNCDKYCHIKSSNMIYSPNDVKREWKEILTKQCKCPFNSKNSVKIINNFPIVLLLSDSHGEQWFNTIIPYARKMNYVVVYVYFWEVTIYNKDFVKLKKIFNLISKVKYIVTTHFLKGKYDKNKFKLNYFSYLDILLKYCDEIYVIHDTPHFDVNPNLCLLATSNYENCFAYLGRNATALKFPIHLSERVHYIDMLPYICLNSSKCYFIWNRIPIYLDNNHLSLQFTITLSHKILKHINFIQQNTKNNLNCSKSYKCSY